MRKELREFLEMKFKISKSIFSDLAEIILEQTDIIRLKSDVERLKGIPEPGGEPIPERSL